MEKSLTFGFLRAHLDNSNVFLPRRRAALSEFGTLLPRPLQHQLAHARRIRGALHGLHDRTDDGTGGLDLALADLLENIRLRNESLVDRGDQGTIIRDDLEAT